MAVRLLHRARKQRPIWKAARTLRRYQRIGKGFLYPEKFIKFYDEMGDFVSEAKGKERKKLHELQTALSFTRMELARDHSFDAYGYAKRNGKDIQPLPQARKWVTQLKEHQAFAGMEYYNESAYEIDYYIKEWEQYILASDIKKSLFLGMHPSATPKLNKMIQRN